MLTEPINYSGYLPIIERVFVSGVKPYVHPTGFDASRIISKVTVPENKINPYFTPCNPQRGNASGNCRIFTTDMEPYAFLESLSHTGDGYIPPNSYKLEFRFSGYTLNFERIKDKEFRELYFKDNSAKEENQEFSQCVDYYLESKGYGDQYDTYGWISVKDDQFNLSGFVHAWKSVNTGTLVHTKTVKLA